MRETEPDPDYRPCVGIMVLNQSGLVWAGRRFGNTAHYEKDQLWQMPQGGIDPGEEPLEAALRELYEETSIRSVELIRESSDWFKYDLPENVPKTGWRAHYRGQTQKWFAVRFTGNDGEIRIESPGDGHDPEFDEWKWMPIDQLEGLIVPFKRAVYRQIVKEFADLAVA